MSTITKIQHKGQVTIPTHVREQAGLSKGDLVEFSFERGKIVITPKLVIDRSKCPAADETIAFLLKGIKATGSRRKQKPR